VTEELCSLLYALLFVPIIVWGALNLLDNLRLNRNRRAFQSLSPETCHQLREKIDSRGQFQPSCAILVPDEAPGGSTASRFGGRLNVEDTDAASAGGTLLLRIEVADLLPPPWEGRTLIVRKQADGSVQAVDCDPARLAPATPEGAGTTLPEWSLQTVRIPRPPVEPDRGGGLLDYDPVVLLGTVPGLQEELSQVASRPAEVLGFVIAPNHTGAYGFELSDIVQVGGESVWLIEDPDLPKCAACDRPGRFLFQFGDLSGSSVLGSSGVCYVFGCEEHPQNLLTLVQSC